MNRVNFYKLVMKGSFDLSCNVNLTLIPFNENNCIKCQNDIVKTYLKSSKEVFFINLNTYICDWDI